MYHLFCPAEHFPQHSSSVSSVQDANSSLHICLQRLRPSWKKPNRTQCAPRLPPLLPLSISWPGEQRQARSWQRGGRRGLGHVEPSAAIQAVSKSRCCWLTAGQTPTLSHISRLLPPPNPSALHHHSLTLTSALLGLSLLHDSPDLQHDFH